MKEYEHGFLSPTVRQGVSPLMRCPRFEIHNTLFRNIEWRTVRTVFHPHHLFCYLSKNPSYKEFRIDKGT